METLVARLLEDSKAVEGAYYSSDRTAADLRQAAAALKSAVEALTNLRVYVEDMQRIMLRSWGHRSSSAAEAITTIDETLSLLKGSGE